MAAALLESGSMQHEPLHLEPGNLYTDKVGANGLSPECLSVLRPSLTAAHGAIHARVQSGELPFLRLHEDRATLDRVLEAASAARARFDDLVVLGIGGSSLGGRALIAALGGAGLRVHFPDNLDPDRFGALIDGLDLDRTQWNAISKSGGTLETIAQLLVVREQAAARLGGYGSLASRLVVTTDPQKGFLRRLARRDGLESFEVPPGVGGRFSVFTPVGLYPAAAAGVDLEGVFRGMAWAAERLASPDPAENPALAAAGLLYSLDVDKGRPVIATVPYADSLRATGEWFAQLWAESLGKAGRGPVPITAVGATDQHSQLQLWMEGPPNMVVAFIEVDRCDRAMPIPAADLGDDPDVAWMVGHDMGHILRMEKRGTAEALTQAGRPNLTWRMPAVTPESIGAWMLITQAMTAYAGGLYGVDPFDQPGVEAGKIIARRLLSQR
jgi:glucose-6-phosphate isomerase